ncbi:monosaccharide-sensing protein 2-like [Coffea eugenioides]|uniref:monosaccharide-sensing protein 2-like n=1 Tax=Coffea eugenioides TaxID=49369 RepID=UPI000F61517A|nr:monosaccharide-sensing protein 2-like [Coffea eugenioides]
MIGPVLVAIGAAIANLLQGWDNAAIAGALLYMKREFKLETQPTVEGLVVAMSLISATAITTFSGGIADLLGRRPMLITSSIFYFISGLMMLWSPNIYILLLARLLDGFGIGLGITFVIIYISETAPPEIRGFLCIFPQFIGSLGMFVSYCMVFAMSLTDSPSWRLMLGVRSFPAIVYFAIGVFYLPESPRWLVSKGRILEAKLVLQRIHGRDDVAGEMTLLVGDHGNGIETSIEQYMVPPADELTKNWVSGAEKEQLMSYGPEEGTSQVAEHNTKQGILTLVDQEGSSEYQNISLVEPLLTHSDIVVKKLPFAGSKGSLCHSYVGKVIDVAGNQPRNKQWDEEGLGRKVEVYTCDGADGESYEEKSPSISHQTTNIEKDTAAPSSHGSILNMRRDSALQGDKQETSSTGMGGWWQLAWMWMITGGQDQNKEVGFKRTYFDECGRHTSSRGSLFSVFCDDVPVGDKSIQTAALVSQPTVHPEKIRDQHSIGPTIIIATKTPTEVPSWKGLFEPGVKNALVIGIGIQLLQQFAGINGVMYYTPQILEQAGVGVLLSDMGISSTSASLLISAMTTFLMLPFVAISMRLIDVYGRRIILLSTIPVLIIALIILATQSVLNKGQKGSATISVVSIVLYNCFFVMGFGPIPAMICAEIFPTHIRGLCIAICTLAFWIGDIIVTYTTPVVLASLGPGCVFGIYAVMCIISWVFVYLRVPETKGMTLEKITQSFSVRSLPKTIA